MYNPRSFAVLLVGLAAILSSCTPKPVPTQPAQPPKEYLSNALDWIEAHSVKIKAVDWAAVRESAMALAANPHTTADTYPAIVYVTKQLGDAATFFVSPDKTEAATGSAGFQAFYPDAVIVGIDAGGPAEKAGLKMGDVILSINDAPPKQWQGTPFIDFYDAESTLRIAIRRNGQDLPGKMTLTKTKSLPGQSMPTGQTISTDRGSVGYIELTTQSGAGRDGELYPTFAQQAIREADHQGSCGWIVDLRRNSGGDIWTYLAAVGPILGEGQVGGFAYLDGMREPWKYEGGKVYWNGQERDESFVEGRIYRLKHPMPPVALLISRATLAAGELAVVAFQGRQGVRTFGEPTGGSPFLVFHTRLSDGAFLGISGASSVDRRGHIYDGSIAPDQAVRIDWPLVGSAKDPVILAARDWLLREPACMHP